MLGQVLSLGELLGLLFSGGMRSINRNSLHSVAQKTIYKC